MSATAGCSRLGRGHQYALGPLPSQSKLAPQRGWSACVGRRGHAKAAVRPIEICSNTIRSVSAVRRSSPALSGHA